MHLASDLLTAERLWSLRGFQRDVIHNFDCISSSFPHEMQQTPAFQSSKWPSVSNLSSVFSSDCVHLFYYPI